MPAVTPIYDLPYAVGTDPPCFGPGTGCDNLESIWCDFTSLVEAQLDENDLIIGRTATAIPMARLFVAPASGTQAIDDMLADGFLTFDTVIFDTDNMATLPRGITPQRNGIYHIDATMLVNGDPTEIGAELEFQLSIGTFALEPNVATLAAIIPGSTSNIFRASTLYAFSNTAPIPKTIFLSLNTSVPGAATALLSASMTVYWHSDL